MPEATVLYSVTAAVIVGLVAWVAFVLKTAKEPWARPQLAAASPADVPVEGSASVEADAKVEAKADEDEKIAEAKAEADEAVVDEAKREESAK